MNPENQFSSANPSQEYPFKFTLAEINVILSALGRLPFNEVYTIIHKIHVQAQEQSSSGDLGTSGPT